MPTYLVKTTDAQEVLLEPVVVHRNRIICGIEPAIPNVAVLVQQHLEQWLANLIARGQELADKDLLEAFNSASPEKQALARNALK